MKYEQRVKLNKQADFFRLCQPKVNDVIVSGGMCSHVEYHLILNEMFQRSYHSNRGVKMLVFGAGRDSVLWVWAANELSKNGNGPLCEITFVENSKKYLDMVPMGAHCKVTCHFYEYGTKNIPMSPHDFISLGIDQEKWPVQIPQLYSDDWDIVFVDAPCGKRPNSIASAAKILYKGRKLTEDSPCVFVHDIDRDGESVYVDHCFRYGDVSMTVIDRMGVIQ